MQPTDAVRYMFLAIAVAASYVQAQEQTQVVVEKGQERRLSKRDAAIFIDNFPIIPISRPPNVVYRRVSKQRYRNPKPKYGPPSYKYRTTKPRKPFKKYKKTVKPKYGPPRFKKGPTRNNYGAPRPTYKPVYGPPKKIPHSYYAAEPDFGEPPQDFASAYQPQTQNFGEPPADSYGAPPNAAVNQQSYDYSPPNSYSEPTTGFGNSDTLDEYSPWQNYQGDQNFDNSYAYSNKHAVYVKPESIVKPDTEFDSIAYADEPHGDSLVEKEQVSFRKNRIPYKVTYRANESQKSWRPKKPIIKSQEVIVGGRYAEPPARFVNKVQSAPVYTDDSGFGSNEFIDPDVAMSATMSPYVNYKNSNMAFSPQNLNDAFSIVDK